MTATMLADARAEALFVSRLQPSDHPTVADTRAAIAEAVRAHDGVRGCALDVAAEFGDHPDTALDRMRWARAEVERLHQRNGGRS
jgi:hypothetical protein